MSASMHVDTAHIRVIVGAYYKYVRCDSSIASDGREELTCSCELLDYGAA